jgi:hypothetical protein
MFETDKLESYLILDIRAWVNQYYPESAYSVLIMFNSEYDDCWYETSLKCILVFDKDGNELVPNKGMSERARWNYPDVMLSLYYWNHNSSYFNDKVEDLVINLR